MKNDTPKPAVGRPANDSGLPRWEGSSLRARRILAELSHLDLAERLGVGQSTVARWERGINEPERAQVKQLAKLLGCRPIDFSRKPVLK